MSLTLFGVLCIMFIVKNWAARIHTANAAPMAILSNARLRQNPPRTTHTAFTIHTRPPPINLPVFFMVYFLASITTRIMVKITANTAGTSIPINVSTLPRWSYSPANAADNTAARPISTIPSTVNTWDFTVICLFFFLL